MSHVINIIYNLHYTKYLYRTLLFTNKTAKLNSCRNFHCNSMLCLKMFKEYENKYAYSIMENKGYAIRLVKGNDSVSLTKKQFDEYLQGDWSTKKTDHIFSCFSKFGVYCSNNDICISNKMFDSYIDHLTDNIKYASDDQLKNLFYGLSKWPETESIKTRNYIEVWVALDDECISRINKWSFDEMLSFVSLFFMLNVTRNSDFSQKCLNKMATKAKHLTPSQLVQTLFFVGTLRTAPFDMHNLEIAVEQKFSVFTVDDLAIMSMGFFKSKTPIRSLDLLVKMIDKIIQDSKIIHEVSLAALLKIIRYSVKINIQSKIYQLLDVLQHEVSRLSVMCNVHLALLNSATLVLHEDCLNKIADTVNESISKTRLKDLERLVLVFGTLNIKPHTKECFFQKVIDELKNPEREAEINKHGRSLSSCVAFLSLSGFYPTDLMNKVLSTQFLSHTYGKHCFVYGKEILTIHNSAEIFHPNIEMNRLSEKCTEILAKKYTDYIPRKDYNKKYNVTETMFLNVRKILEDARGGDNYVVGDHILPHHQRGDIIICNDKNGAPVPISEIINPKKFGLIKKRPDNNTWIVLVIAGRNVAIYNSNAPTGPYLTKIRELEALGYHAALVLWSTYATLQTDEEKLLYLSSLIEKAVKKTN